MPLRNAEPDFDPRERFVLYRLCDCSVCEGTGKDFSDFPPDAHEQFRTGKNARPKCPECRGEGRVRELLATCESPEAVGVALVTLAREGEGGGGPLGLLDRMPECEACSGAGYFERSWIEHASDEPCADCKGSGIKPTGTWLVSPWLPSARNVTDAARTLAKSKKRAHTD